MDYGKYKVSSETIKSAVAGHIIAVESVIKNYEDYIRNVVLGEVKNYPGIVFQVDDIKQEIQLRMLSGIRKFDFNKIQK